MDERERKLGLNEALFREVNERNRELNEAFASFSNRIQLICECGDGTCIQQISMTTAEYEQLRRDPARFVVVRGHTRVGVEEVVAESDGYEIVRKVDLDAITLAAETDPRS